MKADRPCEACFIVHTLRNVDQEFEFYSTDFQQQQDKRVMSLWGICSLKFPISTFNQNTPRSKISDSKSPTDFINPVGLSFLCAVTSVLYTLLPNFCPWTCWFGVCMHTMEYRLVLQTMANVANAGFPVCCPGTRSTQLCHSQLGLYMGWKKDDLAGSAA